MNEMWEPTFDGLQESRVSLSPCELSTQSMSRDEYGVIIQPDEDTSYAGNAAIFWTDPMHLYLRYDWDQWYAVSNSDPDNCANICRRNAATLLVCTNTSVKHHAVRVYHIDKLPESLFGRLGDDTDKPEDTDKPLDDRDDEQPSAATDLCGEIEDGKGTPEDEVGDATALAMLIGEMGGRRIARFMRDPFRADFFELNGHFIAVTYFERDGDWLADEETIDGDLPSWFGEKGIATSPVTAVATIRGIIAPLVVPATFVSLVVINRSCNVVNESEQRELWKEERVFAVRLSRLAESKLPMAADILEALSGESMPELVEAAPRIKEALDDNLPF